MAARTVLVRAPARVRGEVIVPGDKSISHRALLLAAMAEGESTILGRGAGADQDSMVRCLRQLGAKVEERGGLPGTRGAVTVVRGVGPAGFTSPAAPLDCGNSGNTVRFLAGAIAGMPGVEAVLSGDASLSRRPMERVARHLRAMGADVLTADGGTAPLRVRGARLHGISAELEVASAQVKTAVLLAGLGATGKTIVREPGFSRDHTERILERLGVPIHHHLECWIEGPATLPAFELRVPGDPSSAAFWAVLAAVHPDADLTLRGVSVNPSRTRFTRVLTRMGARLDVRGARDLDGEPVADLVVRSGSLRAVQVSADEVPGLVDEVPILAVAAACASGESRMLGLSELRVKEVDRLAAVVEGLTAFGVQAASQESDLHIGGTGRGSHLRGARVTSGGDHRMAMSWAVAGSVATGETTIEGAEAADVSYPAFWEQLARLGGGEGAQLDVR